MTATRHTCTAVLPVPFATPVGAPIYSHPFDTFTDTGWAVVAPAGYSKMPLSTTAGPWAKLRLVPVIAYTAAGGAFTYTLAGLTAGRTYRVTATVANVGAAPVIPNVYAGPSAPLLTSGALAVGTTRAAWSDFTPTGASVVLTVATAATAGSYAGKLSVQAVTVVEVVAEAALDLAPVEASLTLDEAWSPYARGTLVCPMPSQDVLPKIDPRQPQRVRVQLARFGADPLLVSDLTAMLALSLPAKGNSATSPRAHTWTTASPWTGQPLTGPGINPPNGVDGGSRYIADTAGSGHSFSLASATNLPTSSAWTASCYLRSSVDAAVRVTFTRGARSAFVDLTLGAGRWSRAVVPPVTPAASGSSTLTVALLGSVAAGDVLDLTQTMIEAGSSVSVYFDGGIGRVGDPAGFPVWNGTPLASTSNKRYGATTAATFTTYFTGLTVAYLSDLFAEQYGAVLDVTLNQSRAFDLGLRSRALDYAAGTMTLELAGDELLLQDYGRLNTTDPALTPPAGTSLKALVSWALNLIGTDLDPSASDATISAADVVWQVGTSLWDFLDSFVRSAGLLLWCDEARRWYLAPPLTGASGTDDVAALTQLDDVIDREAWADAVVLANHWTDPATGQDSTTYAGQSVSTTATYSRTIVVDKINKGVATVAGAASLLSRIKARGRQVRVSAVSDYAVTPGHTANLTTSTTVIDPCMTSAVTWELPGDEMTLTTKDLPA